MRSIRRARMRAGRRGKTGHQDGGAGAAARAGGTGRVPGGGAGDAAAPWRPIRAGAAGKAILDRPDAAGPADPDPGRGAPADVRVRLRRTERAGAALLQPPGAGAGQIAGACLDRRDIPTPRTYSGTGRSNWDLSTERANATRRVLSEQGVPDGRIRDVTGHADRDLLLPAEPLNAANRRIAILLLRTAPQALEKSMFFFEKKNQKTFAPWRHAEENPAHSKC